MIDHIRLKQKEWFDKIQPFLLKTNLNVGSGLGFFYEYGKGGNVDIASLEISVHPGTVNQEELVLYDGKTIPFPDEAFESVLAMYVLHHAPNPEEVLREMKRVSSRRIILVEELYKHWMGKLYLVCLDIFINFKAGQKSRIYWGSYFNKRHFLDAVEKEGWRIVHYSSSPKAGFDEVLCVAERP